MMRAGLAMLLGWQNLPVNLIFTCSIHQIMTIARMSEERDVLGTLGVSLVESVVLACPCKSVAGPAVTVS